MEVGTLLSFSSPAMVHGAAVHGPVVLAMLAVVGLVLCAVMPRNKTLRWVTGGIHLLLLVAVCLAVATGENAMARVPSEYDPEVWHAIERHEALGEATRIAVAVVFVLTALAFLSGRRGGRHLIWLALLGSVVSLAMVALTAHLGGGLVYELGVGTPPPPALNRPAMPPAAPEPSTPPPTPAVEAPPEPVAEPVPQPEEEAPALGFAADILPLMEAHCNECHAGEDASSGLDLTTLETTLAGGRKAGASVLPGDPDGSPLVQYLEGTRQPRMPRRAPALDEATIATIRDWIAGGAG